MQSSRICCACGRSGHLAHACPTGVVLRKQPAPAPAPAPVVWIPTPRDEQSAFEDWLYRVCPSGDCESVQYQWEISAERAEWMEEPT
jgi:hypothetical protein